MQKLLLASLLIAFGFLLSSTTAAVNSGVVGCYFPTYAYSRPGDGAFHKSHIDPKLCTHLYYGYLSLGQDGGVLSVDKDYDRLNSKSFGGIYDAIKLKTENKDLKVLLSIGGSKVSSDLFSSMAASWEKRQKFVDTAIDVVVQNNFDGVDLNWQYPSKSEVKNFELLLKLLNGALKEKQKLLTVTVAASAFVHLQSSPYYSSVQVDSHCDLINVMAYDFASPTDKEANSNAPLQGPGARSIDYATGTWTSGASNNKIVLGLALHGRSFTLANSANNKPGAAVTGPGLPGPYRSEAGVLSYNEICENLKGSWERGWDSTSLTPYAFKGNQWVSYDDEESLAHKIKFIKSNQLAGAYVFSLDSDDFRGKCGKKYPLLTFIAEGINGKSSFLDSLLKRVG